MYQVVQILDGVIGLLNMCLVFWCLLSWFPNVSMRDKPFIWLDQLIRPMVDPLRRIIPPVGNFDLSAMVLVIILGFLQRLVHSFVAF